MSDISKWSEQQLRNFIRQAQQDSPPRQGSISHDTVNVENALYVNGKPIVGPNVFPNQFTAASGSGTPIGAFADTADYLSLVNDMYANASNTPKYKFYQAYEPSMANNTASVGGDAGLLAHGASIYIPTGGTAIAAGVYNVNYLTYSWALTDCTCAIYGPWGQNALLGTVPPLVTQSASRSVDLFAVSRPVYPGGDPGLVEFPLPAVYMPPGVYSILFTLDGTGTTRPSLLSFIHPITGGLSGETGTFFGETNRGPLVSGPSTNPWPATFSFTTAASSLPYWCYLKMS